MKLLPDEKPSSTVLLPATAQGRADGLAGWLKLMNVSSHVCPLLRAVPPRVHAGEKPNVRSYSAAARGSAGGQRSAACRRRRRPPPPPRQGPGRPRAAAALAWASATCFYVDKESRAARGAVQASLGRGHLALRSCPLAMPPRGSAIVAERSHLPRRTQSVLRCAERAVGPRAGYCCAAVPLLL